jgi:hypothetical protein
MDDTARDAIGAIPNRHSKWLSHWIGKLVHQANFDEFPCDNNLGIAFDPLASLFVNGGSDRLGNRWLISSDLALHGPSKSSAAAHQCSDCVLALLEKTLPDLED